MATNHHHQCHHHPTPTTTTTCYCSTCCTTTHYQPPPPPPSHPPFHSISSHHHHNPPQIHQYAQPEIYQYAPPQNHHNHHTDHYNYYPQTHQKPNLYRSYCHHEDAQQTPSPINPTVSSLIHRIAALESSLRRRKHSPGSSSSLRHAAARTIQTHFRAFLVRRSVTLRHLKDLAYIKSTLNRLKSSVSNKTHFDSQVLSRESMNLLIKLDSIQGRDPMIRDGKRAISRELVRFMELIDEMCIEKQVITVKNVRFGKNSKKSGVDSRVFANHERKFLENLKNQSFDVEIPRKPGVSRIRLGDLTKSEGKCQPKVKKNVRFDEDGNVYRFVKSNHKQASSDTSNGDDDDEVEVEEIGVSSKETEVEEDDSSEISENEMDPRKNLRTRIHHTNEKNQPDQDDDDDDDDDDDEEDDSFVFSAPLPAKMEY